MKKSRNTGFDPLPGAVVLGLLLLWQGVDIWLQVPDWILPSPVEIGAAFAQSWTTLAGHAGVTLTETFLGLLFSLLLGTGFAVWMTVSPLARRILYPLFVISQTIPLMVLAPMLLVWFGFGMTPKVVLVVLVCFFPIAVSFSEGLLHTDPDLEELLRVMGADKWQTFRVAKLPQALPGLFSGLKIAATYSVMGAVLSEWVGGKNGLGIFMTRAMASYRRAALLADTVLVILISLLLFWGVTALERYIMRNRKGNVT